MLMNNMEEDEDNVCKLKLSKKLNSKSPVVLCDFPSGEHLNVDNSPKVSFESYSANQLDIITRDTQKLLKANIGQCTFTGSSSLPEFSNFRYFVGVRNKRTGKMKLYDSLYFHMKPVIKFRTEDETTPKVKSYSESVNDLTANFGSKTKKRALNARLNYKIEAPELNDAIQDMSLENVSLNSSANTSHDTSQSIEYIPPQNRNTKLITEVYDINDIITAEENYALDELSANLINATQEDIEIWKKENRYCNYVISHLEKGMKIEHEKAKYLVYYNYLISFTKLGYAEIRKKDPAPYIPEPFRSKFLNSFTATSSTESKKLYRTFPQQMKEKLLSHILVLALFIDDFTVDVALVHSDVKVSINRIATLFQALGCHVGNRKIQDNMRRIAELKFPLYVLTKYSKKRF